MTTALQINEFIEKNKIQEKLINNFSRLLEKNSAKELDLIDKNIKINSKEIEYKRTENNFNSFRSPILKNNIEIGYYELVFDEKTKLIDEFFVVTKND